MANQKSSLKNKIINIRHIYAYLVAFFSSVLTFMFFYFSNEIIKEETSVQKEINIYEVAKEEAIKLGRMEPDEKPIVQEIGPDGKVIVPSCGDLGEMRHAKYLLVFA